MATIRTLYVALKAQTSDYNKAMKEAATLGKDFGKIFKPTQEAAKQMGTALVAVGAATGGALLLMAKKAADYGDEMLEASQKTGIGTKQLAALRLVAEQSGSSFEGITAGAVKLSKSLFEASTKGGDAAKVFNALGVSFKDSTGHVRDASAVLPEIAERFSKMQDGAEKTALAIKLFGKSGADLIPTLNQGAAGFLAAQRATEKYNIALTEADAKLGDEFNDTLKETNLAMLGLSNQVGKALLPAMTKIVQVGNNVIAMVSSWAKAHPGLTQAIGVTAAVLTGSGGLLIGMSLFLKYAPAMIGNIKLLSTAFLGLSVPARIAVVALIALTGAFLAFPKIRGPVIETLAFINSAAFATVDGMGRLAAVVVRLAQGEFTQAARIWQNMGADMAASWEKRGNMVRDAAKAIGVSISDMNAILKGTPAEMPDIKGLSVDLEGLGKDATKAQSQVEQMWKSLKRESQEIEDLEVVLRRASAAHISLENVTDKFGTTIKDVAGEILRLNSKEMPEYIGRTFAQIKAQEALTEAAKEWQETTQRTMDLYRAEGELLSQRTEIDVTPMISGEVGARIKAAEAVGRHRLELKNATIDLGAQQQMLADVAATMADLADAGYSVSQIEAMVGMKMSDVNKRAKELGVTLHENTKRTIANAAAADDMARSFGESFGGISDDFVDLIVDFDGNWKNSFGRLKNMGLDTAKSLGRSFLDGFFKPVKDGLTSLGETAGKALGNILFGKSGGGQEGGVTGIFGGILNQNAGGILDGILGKGGSGASTPPFVGPGGAGSGLSLLSGIGSLSGFIDPIANQINKLGAGRDSANEIVKSQNAFQKTIEAILNDQSLSDTNKLKMVGNESDIFRAGIGQWIASGGENAVTGNQALATINPWISAIKSDLVKKGATDGSSTSAGGNTFNVTYNLNLDGVTDVPTLIDWLKRNFGGLTEEMVRQVELREGAVVSR